MNLLDNATRVSWSIEEVGITERDVFGAGLNLLFDISQYDVNRHCAKVTVVHRHDRAMTTPVLAPARGIGRTGDPRAPVRHQKRGVSAQPRE
jgi:hypothetical protein